MREICVLTLLLPILATGGPLTGTGPAGSEPGVAPTLTPIPNNGGYYGSWGGEALAAWQGTFVAAPVPPEFGVAATFLYDLGGLPGERFGCGYVLAIRRSGQQRVLHAPGMGRQPQSDPDAVD
jgi:hypothetical protein